MFDFEERVPAHWEVISRKEKSNKDNKDKIELRIRLLENDAILKNK